MIQNQTYLNVIDNSGAKEFLCIKVLYGYKRRYAQVGDIIIGSIKSLRSKRRLTSKVKKGEIYRALIIREKKGIYVPFGDTYTFFENSILLLNKQNKMIGTRIFGGIPKKFRQTKFLKICSLATGLII